MTQVPYGPLWCWGLQGDDALYLSQRTHAWSLGSVVRFLDTTAVSRCQAISTLGEHDGSYTTPPIQCGCIAGPMPDGTTLCAFHGGAMDACAWCSELAAAGSLKGCPGCHATWAAQGLPDWCCPSDEAHEEE